jgi:hypothetical protein
VVVVHGIPKDTGVACGMLCAAMALTPTRCR